MCEANRDWVAPRVPPSPGWGAVQKPAGLALAAGDLSLQKAPFEYAMNR